MRYFRLSSSGIAGSLALLVASLSAPSAHAQSAPATAGGPEAGALEEVIVTAEKRTENAQKTPIAITTISGDEIAERAEDDLQTALRNVPSLQIEGTAQGGAVYIRGVGTNGDSNFVDPAVAVNVDGIYTGRSESLSTGLYDINRIEVLKGPQGTLVGRNADGGDVNIITNSPVIGSSETKINLQYGNFSLVHGDFAQNIPINDHIAMRVAGLVENRDGYFSNDGYASHVQALRAKILLEPTANWTVLAWYDLTHQDGDLATTVAAPPTPFLGPPAQVPTPNGPLDIFDSATDKCAGPAPQGGWLDAQPNNRWYVDPCHPADRIDYRFETGALQSDWKEPWGTVTLIPSYTYSRRYVLTNLVVGDDPFFHGALNSGLDGEDQKTVELRVTSPTSSPVKWVIGYYYLWSNNGGTFGGIAANNFNVNGVNENLFNSISVGQSPTTSKAPYGQITFPLTDTFRFTGGLRYTQDSKSIASQIVSVFIPGYNSGNLIDNVAYSATTYDAGLEYDLAPESMLYAKTSTGYKAGGFDTTATPPKSYGPEHVRAYELGVKNQFLHDSLRLNADIYYYQYTDLQAQYSFQGALPVPVAYLPPTGGPYTQFQQYVANAGAGVNKGAELEMQYRFTPHDELDLSATYTNAHYGNFNPITDPALVSLDGETMAATPENTETASYLHSWDVTSGKITAQVDTKISSSYYSSVNNRGNWYSYQAPYTRSDASLMYEASKLWRVSLWIKNIEDKAQLGFGDFPLNRIFITDPRTYGVNLSATF
jgi:iron complex outermembrane receptor protein